MSSFSDDTVLSKLSALNDTQDSIVAVAQWVMFHRRQAKRSTELWLERLKDSSAHRKLVLIYLANEIVQQSKVKGKPEFLNAFTPLIAEGTEVAYKGCPPDIQKKIRRVVEVWRERNIFSPETQTGIEEKINNVDKGKSAGSKGFGGGLKLGSGFLGGGGGGGGGSIPLELVPLMKTHKDLSEKASSVTIATGSANTEFAKQFDVENLPAPPVYAARLSSLLKTLDTAELAINGAIEARKAHIRNIERLLQQSKDQLAKDEETAKGIRKKKGKTEQTKNDVEAMILRDMENGNGNGGEDGPSTPERVASPEIEALTPPAQILAEATEPVPGSEIHHRHSISAAEPPQPAEFHAGASELLASLSGGFNGGALKRPKEEEENVFEGIDEDLVNIFKKENEEGQREEKRQKVEAPAAEDDDEYRP